MNRDGRAEHVELTRYQRGKREPEEDWIAVEEPLQIRLKRGSLTENLLTTMRTPGHDAELAAGLLFAERILRSPGDLLDIAHTDDPRLPRELRTNTLVVTLRSDYPFSTNALHRPYLVNAACGVCGRTAIDTLVREGFPTLARYWTVSARTLCALPERLRQSQAVFTQTGGLHAAALFDLSGRLLSVREDIGRHNAVDKLVGAEWLAERVPLQERIVLVSGRAGFEIVQKCLMAGVPLLAAVGAPSSLAVDLALESSMTLVGFLRPGRFNVYAAPERIGYD